MTDSISRPVDGDLVDNSKINWPAALARHDRWLRTIVFSRLRDRDDVDEVMQEVALAVVAQGARLADTSKIAPWLYRVTARCVLLFRRKCGRNRKLVARYAERSPPIEQTELQADPLDWLLAGERRQMVRAAVEQLPPLDAAVLLLKYTENWSYLEIANRLGVSHGAVESRLHRARQRLRENLTVMGVVEVENEQSARV